MTGATRSPLTKSHCALSHFQSTINLNHKPRASHTAITLRLVDVFGNNANATVGVK